MELKPCPYCGGEAQYKRELIGSGLEDDTVKCKDCPAKVSVSTYMGYTSKEQAFAAWNKRMRG